MITIGIALAVQAGAEPMRVTVPTIGCPADGQVGPIPPPHSSPRAVALDAAPAQQVAFYQGGVGPGVFAPRGWHCQVSYGSAGSDIVVTPAPIDSAGNPQMRIRGEAVMSTYHEGGTSGRFAVAGFGRLLFPHAAAKFIESVESEDLVPESDFTFGPYPFDVMKHLDSVTTEFTTPANKAGLGTESNLVPSQEAIRGIAVLDTHADWRLTILRVRLGPNHRRLEGTILRLNKKWMQRTAHR